jgi:surface protein
MFNGCSSLAEVPNFDTSKVKDMLHMFIGCTSLVEVPKLDTSK